MPRVAGSILVATALVAGTVLTGSVAYAAPVAPPNTVPGLDVSYWQGPNVDWKKIADNGAKFAIIRATRGTSSTDNATPYVDPYFARNAAEARKYGIIQGAYHFAGPDKSSGATQANFLVDNGGGWQPDGMSLPGALDMESDPYSTLPKQDGVRVDCYNLTAPQMIAWIKDFSTTYFKRTGRYPMIYSNQNWWKNCTSSPAEPTGTAAFDLTNPLWVANYKDPVKNPAPAMMGGFTKYTFWQFWNGNDKPLFPGDQNLFPGTLAQLRAFAKKADKPVANVGVKVTKNGKYRVGKKASFKVEVTNKGPDASGTTRVYVKFPAKKLKLRSFPKACTKASYGLKCVYPNIPAKGAKTFKVWFTVTKQLKAGSKPTVTLGLQTPGILDPGKPNNTSKTTLPITR
ncbi:GH25 family lysozyme M1 (1,4-beta-N-acetylmuramidase) [Actinocorallia herbida]|uniref:GH25 family lysozyme M1 (1,4-beta-N-acetylmuramidase) n=1 Tax=Actinocorallia herbida TaxID=58109 RepID=A0A3N1D9D0_9ACTN|nr:GH25 family lysozyme [Actinocorallia herbida]ROO90143.1 GH25 family lysozyme M1 (1,4-beta-N-acetylmuramidase) [Actinocorallia herbida]